MIIDGNEYQVSRLDTFTQFELARTLSEILSNLALISGKAGAEVTHEQFAKSMCVFSGNLTREQSLNVTITCLSVVTRKVTGGGGWARINTPGSAALMFDDIALPQMLQLMFAVLQEHRLVDFFSVPSESSAPKAGQP